MLEESRRFAPELTLYLAYNVYSGGIVVVTFVHAFVPASICSLCGCDIKLANKLSYSHETTVSK